MHMRIHRIIAVLLSLTIFVPALNAETNFYVSPSGNDSWPGTLPAPGARGGGNGPFKTLEKARDTIRRLKEAEGLPEGGVVVHIRGGVYTLTKSLELTTGDSGTKASPIIYQAYKNEEVRLIGSRQVKGFTPISNPAVLNRIDQKHRDKILQADLKAQGIINLGKLTPRGFGRSMYAAALELFFQDKPMQLARWPNRGWVKITEVPKDPRRQQAGASRAGRFRYEGDRPKRWRAAGDIWVHGYWKYDWAESYEKVKSIDTRKREITTYEPHGVYGYTAGRRYFALNILEELDQAGEWYLDRKSGILYFWPPAPLKEGRTFVSILEEPMISMRDVSYVKLEGVILECCRGTGIEIVGGTQNVIADCTIRNIGNVGINIKGGTKNGVVGCAIYETGDGGINLDGGDRKKLTPAGNYASNNHIHNYSRWVRTYRPAIKISGVGNHIAHNLIHDGPHTGVLFGGNEHVLEFNEIHNVCYETGDVGAFYMGRNWTTRGNIIRYNYFHDIEGPYTHGAMAVYLDDAASGSTIFGNVFYKASRAAFIGGGRDNIVENNIFVDCEPAVHIDARGLGWAKKYIVKGGGWHMYDKLEQVNYKKKPYSTRYPKLAAILEDNPAVPKGNIVRRNICSGGRWLDLQGVDKNIVNIKDNLIDNEPGFIDPANMNFQLKDDSPAYKLGFKRIPIEKIGLSKDSPK
jgi:hypothetical protein